ncbi:BT4734/BF3469 family protein [Flavobacterium sp. HJSW_4]|uniref:BT4734/BF3469 family protein n=1 Tax=Flavobacterium sp. HJSW_4 TaxID=3344660 RepID=UPI0035F4B9AE
MGNTIILNEKEFNNKECRNDNTSNEVTNFLEIPAPIITPIEKRKKNPTLNELIDQLGEYPISFFDNMYSLRPIFNSSLRGYYMGVRGERSTIIVLTDDRPQTKEVNGHTITYFEKGYAEEEYLPVADNYLNNKVQVLQGRKLRGENNNKGYKDQKNLSYVVSGSAIYKLTTPNKIADNIEYRNHIIILDLDLDYIDDLDDVFEKLKQDKYTKIVHKSFSGDGFAVIVEMSKKDAYKNFLLIFKKLQKYYKDTYNLNIDPSCSNIGRLRYLSYDPDIFVKQNELVEITDAELDENRLKEKIRLDRTETRLIDFERKHKTSNYELRAVVDLILEIISSGNRLVEGYINWVKIASSLHGYPVEWEMLNKWRNEEKYHASLNNANQKGIYATISTFYYFCKEAGISIRPYVKKKNIKQEQKFIDSTVGTSLKINKIKNEIDKYSRIEGDFLNGFLSDRLYDLMKFWSNLNLNILVSPASSGKTSMVSKLIEKNYRCLLVVPTQAIIKNKNLKGFVQVFGTIEIQRYINTDESIICTFDKCSQIKIEDYHKFDFIFIDESHLLFTESYRMPPIVLLLKKINAYILDVRNNADKASSLKIVLMSGTPTGEEIYFEPDNFGKKITQKKVFINNKNRLVTFIACEDKDSCYTSFIKKIKKLNDVDNRIFIPTNMGEKWINCVVNCVGSPKFAIYSNNQKNSKVSTEINTASEISEDIKILFITSLGNVGIDINNTDRPITMLVYTDNQNLISGQFIEQYANRFRKMDVEVFVFFIMPKNLSYEKNFVFNYVENPNYIKLLENDISTNLFTNNDVAEMLEDFEVDKEKVRWKELNKELEKHNTNIISVGGFLKEHGYDVNVVEGNPAESIIIEEYKELLKIEKQREEESKIKALDFMLSDIVNLIQNTNSFTLKTGTYSLVGKILTLENEQIFRSIKSLVKKCVQLSGINCDLNWIKDLMLDECKMNFTEIENRLKFMEFVNSDSVHELDNQLIVEVDKKINLIEGKGSLSKAQYEKMLDELAPKHINEAYDFMDEGVKRDLRAKLKKKLAICYEIKNEKRITFKQRFTNE